MKRLAIFLLVLGLVLTGATSYTVNSASPTPTPTAGLFGVDLSTPTPRPKFGGKIVPARHDTPTPLPALNCKDEYPKPAYLPGPLTDIAGMPSKVSPGFWETLEQKGISRDEVEAGITEFFRLRGVQKTGSVVIWWYAVDIRDLCVLGFTSYGAYSLSYVTLNTAWLNSFGHKATTSTVTHELFHAFGTYEDVSRFHWIGKNAKGKTKRIQAMFGGGLVDQAGYYVYGAFNESVVRYLDGDDVEAISFEELFGATLFQNAGLTREDVAKLWVMPGAMWNICTAVFRARYPDLKRCSSDQLYYLITTQEVDSYFNENNLPGDIVDLFFTGYELRK